MNKLTHNYDQHGLKLDINNIKNSIKYTDSQKLCNSLLNETYGRQNSRKK